MCVWFDAAVKPDVGQEGVLTGARNKSSAQPGSESSVCHLLVMCLWQETSSFCPLVFPSVKWELIPISQGCED